MRLLLNKAFQNADLILAVVAILSLSFNVYLFVRQSKRVEMVALETEKKHHQIAQFTKELSVKKEKGERLRDGIIDLKFLNYEMFSLCANKKRYTPEDLKNNLRRINTQRFAAIREFMKLTSAKDIFIPLFTEQVHNDITCNIRWNIQLYKAVHNTDQCQFVQVSKIPYCVEVSKKYANLCMLKNNQKLTINNFDQLFDDWHFCQETEINNQIRKSEEKLSNSAFSQNQT